MHWSPLLRHLHSQPLLQPQRSSSRQACVASERFVQHAYFPAVRYYHSCSTPFTWRWKSLRSRDHRLCPTVTGLVSSPFCVLGKYCLCRRTIAIPFCVNCFLAPLTNSWLLVQLYSKTSNRPSRHSQSSTDAGEAAKAQETGVTSS